MDSRFMVVKITKGGLTPFQMQSPNQPMSLEQIFLCVYADILLWLNRFIFLLSRPYFVFIFSFSGWTNTDKQGLHL